VPRQITLDYNIKFNNVSPRHIRISKKENSLDLRYSSKSQLTSLDAKMGKPKFFIPNTTKKNNLANNIQRYFRARKTIIESDLNPFRNEINKDTANETKKDRKYSGQICADFDNTKNSYGDTRIKYKSNDIKNPDKAFIVDKLNFKKAIREKILKDKINIVDYRKVLNNTGHRHKKTDQGLQTDDSLPKPNYVRRSDLSRSECSNFKFITK
jgi:hypothetical protein